MNKKFHITLLFLSVLICNAVTAGKFYWVNGTGFWDYQSPFNWSNTSGGAAGTTVPGVNDTAYFDANSFAGTAGAATVTIFGGSNPVKIHTIDFSGVTDNPKLVMGANDNLEIYGSVNLDSAMAVSISGGNVTFKATTTGNYIDLHNKMVNFSSIVFDGNGGGWLLKDSILSNASFSLHAGKLVTNGFDIRCNSFMQYPMPACDLQVTKGSKIIVTGNWTLSPMTGLTFKMDPGTTILMSNPGTQTTFNGGGMTYSNVKFKGKGGDIYGVNYYDTLSVNAGAALTIPTDGQNFHALMGYGIPGMSASISGGYSGPVSLYDIDGAGKNCLNLTNITSIDAQNGTYNIYQGSLTASTGFTAVNTMNFNFNAYKTSTCYDGKNDAAIALINGSGGSGNYTYSWQPGNYVDDTLKTAFANTTYTISMYDQCHALYTSTVMAGGSVDNIIKPGITQDTVLCKGMSVSLLATTSTTASVNYSWSPAAGLSSPTKNNPVANPAVTTIYTVAMNSGTCTKLLSVKVTIEDPKAVLSPDSMVVCSGTEFILDASKSTGVINYPGWGALEIADFTDSLMPKIVERKIGGIWYHLTLSGEKCSSKDSIFVDVLDSINKISGRVTYNNGAGPITKGYVLLYMDTSLVTHKGKWPAIDSVQLKTSGDYGFDSNKIKAGSYIIRAYPDPVLYPRLAPMYYVLPLYKNDTCTYYWDSAHVIVTSCSDDFIKNIDFDLMPDLMLLGGKGVLNGDIRQEKGYVGSRKGGIVNTMGVGDPISGVGIGLGKKPNPSANMVATTETDSSGFYQFNNIPPGDYVIYADIPGLPMDSTYEVHITGSDSVAELNYFVDDSVIFIKPGAVGIGNFRSIERFMIRAYPNPYNGRVVLDLNLDERSKVILDVYNLLGMKISVLENGVLAEGLHRYSFSASNSGLPPGVYIVKLTLNDKIYTQRIVELK